MAKKDDKKKAVKDPGNPALARAQTRSEPYQNKLSKGGKAKPDKS